MPPASDSFGWRGSGEGVAAHAAGDAVHSSFRSARMAPPRADHGGAVQEDAGECSVPAASRLGLRRRRAVRRPFAAAWPPKAGSASGPVRAGRGPISERRNASRPAPSSTVATYRPRISRCPPTSTQTVISVDVDGPTALADLLGECVDPDQRIRADVQRPVSERGDLLVQQMRLQAGSTRPRWRSLRSFGLKSRSQNRQRCLQASARGAEHAGRSTAARFP